MKALHPAIRPVTDVGRSLPVLQTPMKCPILRLSRLK